MKLEIDFGHVLAQERVKRWHIVATVREQTLPEHAAMVTYIAEKILSLIPMKGMTATNIEGITLLTIQMALYHDCHEVLVGDLPSVRKKHMADQEVTSGVVDALQDTIKRRYGSHWYMAVNTVLKIADIAEAIRFISKYGVPGQHKDNVVAGLHTSLQKAIDDIKYRVITIHGNASVGEAVKDATWALINRSVLTEV